MNGCFGRRSARLVVALTGVLVTAIFGEWGHTAEPVSLFDGKSLQGWEGDSQYWRVDDGVIVGEIPAGPNADKEYVARLAWRPARGF